MTYHHNTCLRFLAYLVNYFGIEKPVNLFLEENIHLDGLDYKGRWETIHPQGTAQSFDTHYEIKLSLKKSKTRNSLLWALAHEYGHIVQFSQGKYLSPGIDWELEIEASKIGAQPYREFLKINFPKSYARLGQPK